MLADLLFLQQFALQLLGEGNNGGGQQPMGWLWVMLIAIFVLYYFIVIRGQRRERERRQELLDSLKKNDRVVTIGGIIGTVASVSQDGREVTLKIDDNARIKMLRSAIQGPLKEKEADEKTNTKTEKN